VYLENWRAWDEARGQVLGSDSRRFHLFASGRLVGAYGRYFGARSALAGSDGAEQAVIAKWMDTAYDHFERVLLDVYWKDAPLRADENAPPNGPAQDHLLIERLSYDYPDEWEGRYAVIADGAIQGAYATVREAHARVESLKGVGDVFIAPVGPPRQDGPWYVKVIEAYYQR
jgi:hypothetical protein